MAPSEGLARKQPGTGKKQPGTRKRTKPKAQNVGPSSLRRVTHAGAAVSPWSADEEDELVSDTDSDPVEGGEEGGNDTEEETEEEQQQSTVPVISAGSSTGAPILPLPSAPLSAAVAPPPPPTAAAAAAAAVLTSNSLEEEIDEEVEFEEGSIASLGLSSPPSAVPTPATGVAAMTAPASEPTPPPVSVQPAPPPNVPAQGPQSPALLPTTTANPTPSVPRVLFHAKPPPVSGAAPSPIPPPIVTAISRPGSPAPGAISLSRPGSPARMSPSRGSPGPSAARQAQIVIRSPAASPRLAAAAVAAGTSISSLAPVPQRHIPPPIATSSAISSIRATLSTKKRSPGGKIFSTNLSSPSRLDMLIQGVPPRESPTAGTAGTNGTGSNNSPASFPTTAGSTVPSSGNGNGTGADGSNGQSAASTASATPSTGTPRLPGPVVELPPGPPSSLVPLPGPVIFVAPKKKKPPAPLKREYSTRNRSLSIGGELPASAPSGPTDGLAPPNLPVRSMSLPHPPAGHGLGYGLATLSELPPEIGMQMERRRTLGTLEEEGRKRWSGGGKGPPDAMLEAWRERERERDREREQGVEASSVPHRDRETQPPREPTRRDSTHGSAASGPTAGQQRKSAPSSGSNTPPSGQHPTSGPRAERPPVIPASLLPPPRPIPPRLPPRLSVIGAGCGWGVFSIERRKDPPKGSGASPVRKEAGTPASGTSTQPVSGAGTVKSGSTQATGTGLVGLGTGTASASASAVGSQLTPASAGVLPTPSTTSAIALQTASLSSASAPTPTSSQPPTLELPLASGRSPILLPTTVNLNLFASPLAEHHEGLVVTSPLHMPAAAPGHVDDLHLDGPSLQSASIETVVKAGAIGTGPGRVPTPEVVVTPPAEVDVAKPDVQMEAAPTTLEPAKEAEESAPMDIVVENAPMDIVVEKPASPVPVVVEPAQPVEVPLPVPPEVPVVVDPAAQAAPTPASTESATIPLAPDSAAAGHPAVNHGGPIPPPIKIPKRPAPKPVIRRVIPTRSSTAAAATPTEPPPASAPAVMGPKSGGANKVGFARPLASATPKTPTIRATFKPPGAPASASPRPGSTGPGSGEPQQQQQQQQPPRPAMPPKPPAPKLPPPPILDPFPVRIQIRTKEYTTRRPKWTTSYRSTAAEQVFIDACDGTPLRPGTHYVVRVGYALPDTPDSEVLWTDTEHVTSGCLHPRRMLQLALAQERGFTNATGYLGLEPRPDKEDRVELAWKSVIGKEWCVHLQYEVEAKWSWVGAPVVPDRENGDPGKKLDVGDLLDLESLVGGGGGGGGGNSLQSSPERGAPSSEGSDDKSGREVVADADGFYSITKTHDIAAKIPLRTLILDLLGPEAALRIAEKFRPDASITSHTRLQGIRAMNLELRVRSSNPYLPKNMTMPEETATFILDPAGVGAAAWAAVAARKIHVPGSKTVLDAGQMPMEQQLGAVTDATGSSRWQKGRFLVRSVEPVKREAGPTPPPDAVPIKTEPTSGDLAVDSGISLLSDHVAPPDLELGQLVGPWYYEDEGPEPKSEAKLNEVPVVDERVQEGEVEAEVDEAAEKDAEMEAAGELEAKAPGAEGDRDVRADQDKGKTVEQPTDDTEATAAGAAPAAEVDPTLAAIVALLPPDIDLADPNVQTAIEDLLTNFHAAATAAHATAESPEEDEGIPFVPQFIEQPAGASDDLGQQANGQPSESELLTQAMTDLQALLEESGWESRHSRAPSVAPAEAPAEQQSVVEEQVLEPVPEEEPLVVEDKEKTPELPVIVDDSIAIALPPQQRKKPGRPPKPRSVVPPPDETPQPPIQPPARIATPEMPQPSDEIRMPSDLPTARRRSRSRATPERGEASIIVTAPTPLLPDTKRPHSDTVDEGEEDDFKLKRRRVESVPGEEDIILDVVPMGYKTASRQSFAITGRASEGKVKIRKSKHGGSASSRGGADEDASGMLSVTVVPVEHVVEEAEQSVSPAEEEQQPVPTSGEGSSGAAVAPAKRRRGRPPKPRASEEPPESLSGSASALLETAPRLLKRSRSPSLDVSEKRSRRHSTPLPDTKSTSKSKDTIAPPKRATRAPKTDPTAWMHHLSFGQRIAVFNGDPVFNGWWLARAMFYQTVISTSDGASMSTSAGSARAASDDEFVTDDESGLSRPHRSLPVPKQMVRLKIHYEGYLDKYDEWILLDDAGKERIKGFKKVKPGEKELAVLNVGQKGREDDEFWADADRAQRKYALTKDQKEKIIDGLPLMMPLTATRL